MRFVISVFYYNMIAVTPQCTVNFKDELTFDGRVRGQNTTIETRLIPNMGFTCNGTIVGFTMTGTNGAGVHDPKIQVWRENKAQCGSYQKMDSEIVIHESSCSNITQLAVQKQVRIFHCALKPELQASVLYGDILGIELPPTSDSDFDLFFTDEGPTNYVFLQQVSSEIDIIQGSHIVKEQPQIQLDIVSGS